MSSSVRGEIFKLQERTVENIDQILRKNFDIYDPRDNRMRMFECLKAEDLFDLDKRRICIGFIVTASVVAGLGAILLVLIGGSAIGRYYLWNETLDLGLKYVLIAGGVCTALGGAVLGPSIYQIKKLDRRKLTDNEVDQLLDKITDQMESERNRFKNNLTKLGNQRF